jgi:hypothetical protein
VPLVVVVAAGAGQVQENAAETELGELSLHIVLESFWLKSVLFFTVVFICFHAFQQEKRGDLTAGLGGVMEWMVMEWWNNGGFRPRPRPRARPRKGWDIEDEEENEDERRKRKRKTMRKRPGRGLCLAHCSPFLFAC